MRKSNNSVIRRMGITRKQNTTSARRRPPKKHCKRYAVHRRRAHSSSTTGPHGAMAELYEALLNRAQSAQQGMEQCRLLLEDLRDSFVDLRDTVLQCATRALLDLARSRADNRRLRERVQDLETVMGAAVAVDDATSFAEEQEEDEATTEPEEASNAT
eukprot:TRINITY_DN41466_c0_g1_i1.p1 TRINITY_DN41466_c0_g1~~TRINITY_DN41466_c0_g1_i1.p1  ORF type:complete len:166 (-),score=31.95 TRINITY_DN41466_c0_g1_i1:92-565(-)